MRRLAACRWDKVEVAEARIRSRWQWTLIAFAHAAYPTDDYACIIERTRTQMGLTVLAVVPDTWGHS